MPELVLLLVGEWHEDECAKDADFAWCRTAPGFVWLGRRSDEEAARLILCADVGILPFRVEPFNDAALPYRILKYARLGRRTVSPELAGVHTWDRAVTTAADADAFVAALRAHAGARVRPDVAAARVGARADRRARQRAAVGAPARARRRAEPCGRTAARGRPPELGVTPVLLLAACRRRDDATPSPKTPPVQAALDELRRELGTDRVELGELVVLGAEAKVAALRAATEATTRAAPPWPIAYAPGDVGVDRAAADEVRAKGWVRE